jgi:hypothetical protein
MWAIMIHTSAEAMERSTSLANLRHLPSHAKVRSTTRRRGRTSKPLLKEVIDLRHLTSRPNSSTPPATFCYGIAFLVQTSFLHYTNIGFSLVAAKGLVDLLQERDRLGRRLYAVAAIATAVGLVILQLHLMPTGGLRWLQNNLSDLAMTTLRGRAPGRIPCSRQADAELLQFAAANAEKPVVAIVQDLKEVSEYCEMFWWVTERPIQTINLYSLANVPGTARGATADRLDKQRQLMYEAIYAAHRKELAVQALSQLSLTVADDEQLFVLTVEGLAFERSASVSEIARNGRLVLYRIN